MLAEGANQTSSDRAMILTPVQDRTTGSCVHFWYSQRNLQPQMRLNVYLSTSNTILWSHTGNFDNRWTYAQVSVRSPNQQWQAVFEAEVLVNNPPTSIAIDDVSITRGLCPNPGDCTFEVDFCGWTNDPNDAEMDWLVGQGVHSFGTGPTYGKQKPHCPRPSSYFFLFVSLQITRPTPLKANI